MIAVASFLAPPCPEQPGNVGYILAESAHNLGKAFLYRVRQMRDRQHTSTQVKQDPAGLPGLPSASPAQPDRTAVNREFKLPEMAELASIPALAGKASRNLRLEEPMLLEVQPLSGKFDCISPHAGEAHGRNCLAYADPREVTLSRLTNEDGESASVIAQRVNCLVLINDRENFEGQSKKKTYHGDVECQKLFGKSLDGILKLPDKSTLQGSDGRTYTLGALGEFNGKLFRKVFSEDLAVLPVKGQAYGHSRAISEVQNLDEYGSEKAARPTGLTSVGMERIRVRGHSIQIVLGADAVHSILVFIPRATDSGEVDSKKLMGEIASIVAELPLSRVSALEIIATLPYDGDFNGRYVGDGRIELAKSCWSQGMDMRHTIYHEFGHAMANQVYGSTSPDAGWSFAMWNDKALRYTALGYSNLAMAADGSLVKTDGGYALTDRREDYAETVAAYILDNEGRGPTGGLRDGLEFRFAILDRQCASRLDPLPRK